MLMSTRSFPLSGLTSSTTPLKSANGPSTTLTFSPTENDTRGLGLIAPSSICCVIAVYLEGGKKFPDSLRQEVDAALKKVEKVMGMKFGDPANPLLVSCRSGARSSM